MIKKYSIFILIISLFLITPALAEESVEELKNHIQVLQERITNLEQQQQQSAIQPSQERQSHHPFFNRSRGFWDPFEELMQMQVEMDRMFQDSFRAGMPNQSGMFSSNMAFDPGIGIDEKEDTYTITFDMEGMDQSKIDIEVNQRALTIRGEQSSQQSEEGDHRYFNAHSYATFLKTIPIPEDVDTKNMKSETKDNKLIITLPRKKST